MTLSSSFLVKSFLEAVKLFLAVFLISLEVVINFFTVSSFFARTLSMKSFGNRLTLTDDCFL